MAFEIPAGKECGNRTRHHQGGRKDLSDHRRERRGQIEAATKDHVGEVNVAIYIGKYDMGSYTCLSGIDSGVVLPLT